MFNGATNMDTVKLLTIDRTELMRFVDSQIVHARERRLYVVC